jgi:photosystem II stability/assembly factor-like uncharacterized protein
MKIRSCVIQVASPLLVLFAASLITSAQWAMQNSNTTADLRGIHSIGGGVVWASGTNGTVLRTVDGGSNWQVCAVPPGADKLDFRGVQAFDAMTAIVMSSGKGELSRLYKTTDGCKTWKLVFTNPDKDGFWDAIQLNRFDKDGYILGDPVDGKFAVWETADKGVSWSKVLSQGLDAMKDDGAFAASNSAFLLEEAIAIGFVTGGPEGSGVFLMQDNGSFKSVKLPLGNGDASSGAFSIEARDWCCWVSVGGDYTKGNNSFNTAAYTNDGAKTWSAAQTMPHGYRSAVAYDALTKSWITVGPNGTDVSTDDGRNWRALRPDVARGEAVDADRNWNALSLPFVVGPKGRIGKLNQGSGSRVQGSAER